MRVIAGSSVYRKYDSACAGNLGLYSARHLSLRPPAEHLFHALSTSQLPHLDCAKNVDQ